MHPLAGFPVHRVLALMFVEQISPPWLNEWPHSTSVTEADGVEQLDNLVVIGVKLNFVTWPLGCMVFTMATISLLHGFN
jgi:hypothetical protein